LLALDRQERGGSSASSAVQEVEEQFGIPVIAVLNLADLMQHMQEIGLAAELASMRAYRAKYGL
jgi:orotate phosphoribosyltransferase